MNNIRGRETDLFQGVRFRVAGRERAGTWKRILYLCLSYKTVRAQMKETSVKRKYSHVKRVVFIRNEQ